MSARILAALAVWTLVCLFVGAMAVAGRRGDPRGQRTTALVTAAVWAIMAVVFFGGET